MSPLIVATLAACALSLLPARPADAQPNPASEIRRHVTGSFRFVDPGSNHPITVWFCRTSTATPDTRIVFVMHGSDSQTARQACDLASPYIEPLNAIVLAPQFAEEYFPADAYMFGNMIDAASNVLPKSAWALTTIERLFDMVRDEMGLHRTEYDIVGFSGGAQFVHRLALFVPEARFRRAVAASAGRYAFPPGRKSFPTGSTEVRSIARTCQRRSRGTWWCYSPIEISRIENANPVRWRREQLGSPEGCGSLPRRPTKRLRWVYRSAGSSALCLGSIIPQCPW